MYTLPFSIEKSIVADCREKGRKHQSSKCRIRLPKGCGVYCAETLQGEVMGVRTPSKPPICDCIVRDPKTRMSLVELKGGRPRHNVIEQFNGGVAMLPRVMGNKGPVCLQAVLVMNKPFTDRSERIVLKKPLDGVAPPVRIERIRCGDEIPEKYVQNCRIL